MVAVAATSAWRRRLVVTAAASLALLVAVPTQTSLAEPDAAVTEPVPGQGEPAWAFVSTPPGGPRELPGGPSDPAARAVAFWDDVSSRSAPQTTDEVVVSSVSPGQRGGDVVRLQQRVDGVPVIGGEVVVDLDRSGNLRAINSETTTAPPIGTKPTVSAGEAEVRAVEAAAKAAGVRAAGLVAAPAELWIYDPAVLGVPDPVGARLVWRTDVTAAAGAGVNQLVLIDARTGGLALALDQARHALNRKICDAVNQNAERPCANPARQEGGAAIGQSDVDDAYDHAGETYEFFANVLGRDSIDGKGMPMVSTVRYCSPNDPCPWGNSFWDSATLQMYHGAGESRADDVVGHEFTHGVTQYMSGLFYHYQSGAIDESLADIFGEFIDQRNGPDANGPDLPAEKWVLFEEMAAGQRSMKDPTLMGHPDRTGSPLWHNELPEKNADVWDSGGVHSNSGVGNKFAYLIAEGDSFNGQTVVGLGNDKAAKIIYGAAGLLTSGADYRSFAAALRQSCATLTGTAGITSADCESVDRAVLATEMDVTPVKAPLVDAGVCPAGRSRQDVWADGFEGSTNWTFAHTIGSKDWVSSHQYARSGHTSIQGEAPSDKSDLTAATAGAISIPPDAFLRFAHSYQLDTYRGEHFDGGTVEYNDGRGWTDAGPMFVDLGYTGRISTSRSNAMAGRSAFVGASAGYSTSRLDLGSLAGRNVRFRFRLATDTTVGSTGWFIDDLEIYRCPGPASAPAVPPVPGPGAPPPVVPPAGPSLGSPTPAPPTQGVTKRARAKVRKAKGGSRLRVRVKPNLGKRKQWRFVVQKQNTAEKRKASGRKWATLPRVYRTKGRKHVRSLRLTKGRYRVAVKPRYGYEGAISRAVKLSGL